MLNRAMLDPSPRFRERGARSTRRAFTLAEMLAVIAIIGVLMMLLLPSVRHSMQQASSTVCLHNLREIGRALHEYQLDHRGWLPVADATAAPAAESGADTPGTAPSWIAPLTPKYVTNPAVLVCPADPARSMLHAARAAPQRFGPAHVSSYGMNNVIRVAGVGHLERHAPSSPLETILLADLGPDVPVDGVIRRNDGWLPWDDGFHPAIAGLRDSWLTGRHFGHVNVLTVGGAVKHVRTREMMEERIKSYYGDCASGGCPLCTVYTIPHYSFAPDRLYWWTGELNAE